MVFERLDKVEYKGCIAYIHHISSEGLIPALWLYGVPDEKRRTYGCWEFVSGRDFMLVKKLNRKTDFTEWLDEGVGITGLMSEDEEILLSLCKENKIDMSDANLNCYYKGLWFIKNNKLQTVQTIFEAKEQGVEKIYDEFLEYVFEHEK